MGNKQQLGKSSQTQKQKLNLKYYDVIPSEYEVLQSKIDNKTQQQIIILQHLQTKDVYFLKKYNFLDKNQYQKTFQRIKLQSQSYHKNNQYQNVLNCIRIWSQQLSSFCNNNYKIYAIYQYSQLTLRQEIKMRKIQRRSFDQTELWSILECCINSMKLLPNYYTFEPQKIFILNQGKIKVLNRELLTQSDQYRYCINERIYYAPEKISNFQQNQHKYTNSKINSFQKEIIFSLGLTLLQTATFQDMRQCYDFQNYQFNKQYLQKYLLQLKYKLQREDNRLYQTIQGMAEIDPSRRFSLKNIQEVILIKQKIDQSLVLGKQIDSRTTFDYNAFNKYSPKYLPKNNHKKSLNNNISHSNSYFNQSVERDSIHKNFKKFSNVSNNQENYLSTQKKIYEKSSARELVEPYSQSFYISQNHKNSLKFPNFQSIQMSKQTNINNFQNQHQLHEDKSSKTFQPYLPKVLKKSKLSSIHQSLINSYQPLFQKQKSEQNLFTDFKLLQQCKLTHFQKKQLNNNIEDISEKSQQNSRQAYQTGQHQKVKSDSYLMSQRSQTSLFNLTQNNSQTNTKKKIEISNKKLQSNQQLYTFKLIKLPSNQIQTVNYQKVNYYYGSLKNGKRQGAGRLTFSDKKLYEGQFKQNDINGYGVLYSSQHDTIYEGYWFNNSFHGEGILNNLFMDLGYSNKPIDYRNLNSLAARNSWIRYEGTFKNGLKNGKGFLIFYNGQSYQGEFKDDIAHGKGKFRDLCANYIYGIWNTGYLISQNQSSLDSFSY